MQKQLIEEKVTRQKEITKATIDGQEKERGDIGKELHDNVNQILTSAKLYLECASNGSADKHRQTSIHLINSLVNNVADRSYILIHAYNDAMKESKGCIAPVSICSGEGKGSNSRIALKKLLALTESEFEKGSKVFITIKSVQHESTH